MQGRRFILFRWEDRTGCSGRVLPRRVHYIQHWQVNTLAIETLDEKKTYCNSLNHQGVLEDVLTRGLDPSISEGEMRAYMEAALDLVKDMKFFLVAAQNLTSTEDSYTSMGKVKIFTMRIIKTIMFRETFF